MTRFLRIFRDSLRGRLILLGILPAIATGGLALLAGYWSSARIQETRLAAELQAAEQRLAHAVAEAGRRMHAHVAGMVPRPNIIQSLGTRDADRTQRLLVDTFTVIRTADVTLSILEATDATGKVLDRAQSPGQRGDDRMQADDVRRALAGEVVTGAMLPPGSTELTIGATLPVRDSGRIVGTVRAAMRLDASAAVMLSTVAGGDVLLFTGDRLTATTFAGLGQERLPPTILGAVRDGASQPFQAELHGKAFKLVLKPLLSRGGETIGAIAVALPLEGWEAAMRESLMLILGALLLALLFAMPAATLAARRTSRALGGIADTMTGIAAGRLDLPVPARERGDEIGRMGRALEVFRLSLVEKLRLERHAVEERSLRERRAAALDSSTAAFGGSVGTVLDTLEEAARRMTDAASSMAAGAGRTEAQAQATANEAGMSAGNLAAVASAAEQLTASVAEIGRQVGVAAQVARDAVAAAEATDSRMATLTASAERVTEVTRLIGDIAGQTNLLALNATIEAARAGEAGKGFAVVASEVKALAGQTAKATDEVSGQIKAMRDATEGAADAIKAMLESISRMDEVASAIAAAVEQQGTATREINDRVQDVSGTVNRVAEAMGDLASSARDTGRLGEQMLGSADAVGSETRAIRGEVDDFLGRLAAESGERRRHARLDMLGADMVWLRHGGVEHRAALRDISESGAALKDAPSLERGASVEIMLPGSAAWLSATIVRAEDGVVALAFGEKASGEVRRVVERLKDASARQAA
ncbi:methyl-accepting chemotaxis protein [Paracraurococcus ruber]|uniref:Methyl-accepting chemotaxis protein n=1 Tax=Paracraurococcus ruber TaxID=77675 RepID=A0ABS1D3A6_9PROT|nr:methyl-accepting chemotaxis protein [Paracraurococcus ruber]MBK1661036.1 hypothetical protein [Paracraurococcus ruber]TDG19071.1 HAMP domain-containing protein [Paracraurococcus ruber]